MSTDTLREQIDEIVPRCGERDCDTCDERHIKLYELVQSLIATDKAQAVIEAEYKGKREMLRRIVVKGYLDDVTAIAYLTLADAELVKALQTPVKDEL